MPEFSAAQSGGDAILTSKAAEASVVIDRAPDGQESYTLSQNGAPLPCSSDDGSPRESDLFAAPNDPNTGQNTANGFLVPVNRIPLTAMAALHARATVTLRYHDVLPAKGCAVSQGGALIAVILNDLGAHQTLFYQLDLGGVCGPQPDARGALCRSWYTDPEANFFFSNNPFGVDDDLPLLGGAWLGNGATRRIDVDVLPRLLRFIAEAPAPMDHDPSHWVLAGYYNGQHIWGDVAMTTVWRDVGLAIERH